MKNRPNIGNVFQWATVGIALCVMYDVINKLSNPLVINKHIDIAILFICIGLLISSLGNLFKKGD
jgi:hypothetical protein